MSLPTPEKIDAAVKVVAEAAKSQVNLLGFTIDASQLQAVIQAAVDALCMKAWREAHAAGQAAAVALTTEDAAEAAQRKP
jgi:uncharacterized protein (DUF2237 family)